MAKLKRASFISNWDFLDNFYEYEVKGLNIKPNGFERGFCRCGNISTSYLEKCSCGNFSFNKLENTDINCYGNKIGSFKDKEIIDQKYFYKVDVDKDGNKFFEIIKKRLYFQEQSSTSGEIIFDAEDVIVLRFYENKLLIDDTEFYDNCRLSSSVFNAYFIRDFLKCFDSNQGEEIYNFFINNCQFLIDAYKDYSKYFTDDIFIEARESHYKYFKSDKFIKEDFSILYSTVLGAILKYSFKKILDDNMLYRYPNVFKAFILDFTRACISYLENSYFQKIIDCDSFDSLLESVKGNYDIAEFTALNNHSLTLLIKSFNSWWYRYLDFYSEKNCNISNFFSEIDSFKRKDLADMIFNYVKNGLIMYYEGHNILIGLLRADNEKIDLFKMFLKENISNTKMNLIGCFEKQIALMEEKNIPLKEENFKLKNYNFLVNQACLAETYRLPQEKVDMFLDMFEVNPLEAMTLISNRRKMTKKEIDAFLEVMFKN